MDVMLCDKFCGLRRWEREVGTLKIPVGPPFHFEVEVDELQAVFVVGEKRIFDMSAKVERNDVIACEPGQARESCRKGDDSRTGTIWR